MTYLLHFLKEGLLVTQSYWPISGIFSDRVCRRSYALLFHFCDRSGYPSLNSRPLEGRGVWGFQKKGLAAAEAFAVRRSRRIRSFLKTFDLNNKFLSEIEEGPREIQLLQGDEYLFQDSLSSSFSFTSLLLRLLFVIILFAFTIQLLSVFPPRFFLLRFSIRSEMLRCFHNFPSGDMCHLHYAQYIQVEQWHSMLLHSPCIKRFSTIGLAVSSPLAV